MKAILRYAEDAVNDDDAKLTVLGWGGRPAATALEPPGQPRSLEAPRQDEGWVFLDWKKPTDGGAVAAYKIERRERSSGNWTLIHMAIDSEATRNTASSPRINRAKAYPATPSPRCCNTTCWQRR